MLLGKVRVARRRSISRPVSSLTARLIFNQIVKEEIYNHYVKNTDIYTRTKFQAEFSFSGYCFENMSYIHVAFHALSLSHLMFDTV